ncbi:hypothetical protein C8R45DRAFT_602154 [Mycena sanguinolenta]|nr:hypothetical protein C8R45DRAFT_602154 [Mycena sanguinolenta]
MATQTTPSMNARRSSASQSCLSTASSCSVPSPGTLYLFAFLATMVLLAIIAGGLLTRSVQLRRRQRDLISNRARQGVQPEPNLRFKPRIFDVQIGGAATENELQHWEFIMPLGAVIARAQAPPSIAEPSRQHSRRTVMMTALETVSALPICSRRRRILRQANVSVPVEAPLITQCSEKTSDLHTVVVYTIAMPEDPRLLPATCDDEEKKLPFFELGVVAIDVVGTVDGLYVPDEEREVYRNNCFNVAFH